MLRLGELERLNLKINRAYLLKELFRYFWDYHRAGWAKKYRKQVVLVGNAFPTCPDARLRLDGASPRR